MAVRRERSALRAAAAWGVGALLPALLPPPDARVPLRTELSKSRAPLLSSGVRARRRGLEFESPASACCDGVRIWIGVLSLALLFVDLGVDAMMLAASDFAEVCKS